MSTSIITLQYQIELLKEENQNLLQTNEDLQRELELKTTYGDTLDNDRQYKQLFTKIHKVIEERDFFESELKKYRGRIATEIEKNRNLELRISQLCTLLKNQKAELYSKLSQKLNLPTTTTNDTPKSPAPQPTRAAPPRRNPAQSYVAQPQDVPSITMTTPLVTTPSPSITPTPATPTPVISPSPITVATNIAPSDNVELVSTAVVTPGGYTSPSISVSQTSPSLSASLPPPSTRTSVNYRHTPVLHSSSGSLPTNSSSPTSPLNTSGGNISNQPISNVNNTSTSTGEPPLVPVRNTPPSARPLPGGHNTMRSSPTSSIRKVESVSVENTRVRSSTGSAPNPNFANPNPNPNPNSNPNSTPIPSSPFNSNANPNINANPNPNPVSISTPNSNPNQMNTNANSNLNTSSNPSISNSNTNSNNLVRQDISTTAAPNSPPTNNNPNSSNNPLAALNNTNVNVIGQSNLQFQKPQPPNTRRPTPGSGGGGGGGGGSKRGSSVSVSNAADPGGRNRNSYVKVDDASTN